MVAAAVAAVSLGTATGQAAADPVAGSPPCSPVRVEGLLANVTNAVAPGLELPLPCQDAVGVGVVGPAEVQAGVIGSAVVAGLGSLGLLGASSIDWNNIGPDNTGSFNLGWANTGSNNVGSANTGSGNVGSANTGSGNVGSANTGSGNLGSANTGSFTYGSLKTGIGSLAAGSLGIGTLS
ncbi:MULTISPECIES: pentapeptide repeat-containing protein [unclassified Rhodococcus (in: high G+C Gram-positive bacteria)]|uniref:pentapeptide repeat-containing protein n=1 Tax=unclassified Rhodococcus (in: high G+C Gram-positive bacteria) TaxID=192944 RepID=UPI000E0C0857|nr:MULTISPECIES: pentapeptide repeat-containing protein [unclassified Rhodococcus (in: high G+C Gram-positive bacteria)]QKT09589.1 pentapeptide repeat-containing protein [Rhodococcus sp. W8901]